MDLSPPTKPPRGVKPIKETSGLLMSVIRTLSASETNEQRDREKAKLENDYKICDQKIDELVSRHGFDLSKVMQLFVSLSEIVTTNRGRIENVRENLQDCKKKLRCRKDELKNLWIEGLEYKYMLHLLDEIEKMNKVPNCLSLHMERKQYLNATMLLVDAVCLGKGMLEGVETLKDLSLELEQKKEQLHLQLLSELKLQLYTKSSQHVLALCREGSGREGVTMNSTLRGSVELRGSEDKNRANNIFNNIPSMDNGPMELDFSTEQKPDATKPGDNYVLFTILVKSLSILDKLPFAVNEIVQEMHIEISQIIERTTQYVKDYIDLLDQGMVLEELIQILFKQLKAVADHQNFFLKCLDEACVEHSIEINPYNINYYWSQVQAVLQSFLTDYLDIQNVTSVLQINNINSISDISMYFSRRKQTVKRNFLFKFDDSSSALSLNNAIKSSKKDKFLICPPHPNNVLIIYTPFMCFIEELEQKMGVEPHGSSNLYQFITLHVSNAFLKRKSDEIMDQVESCVRAADAWKATILLDSSADYKPLLVSTVAVERCIREWKTILTSLPNYSETIAEYSCKALKEYRDTCDAAYKGIVQPHSEDKWICSATWLRDEDISRFLKSLPNWLNLKAQQESHARSERNKRTLKKEHPSEEESPEDVRMRNRREAEILASNLGEGGVSAGEILSDMSSLKELAQLQESMEWFSIRMFEFTSDFRTEPPSLSPPKHDNGHNESSPPVSAATLQQLTSVAQEFDELANTCLLLLHLEVRVQCFHYLLNQTQHNKETQEPDPKVLELNRVLATVDEAIISSLHPRKCKYIFEGLGHLVAKILISSAQYMSAIDEGGIQRMCRNIFALQQTLTNITMTREVALDHARHYFELFFLTPEEILNGIVDKGPEFSELEYMNAFQLLNRSKSGNETASVTVHLERLSDILGEVGVTL